jgi:uncharacterized membrane protein/bacillopeptidase F (M6 metalloprotease family)
MSQAGISISGNESWKRTLAIFVVAIMVMMVAAPMVSVAQAPAEAPAADVPEPGINIPPINTVWAPDLTDFVPEKPQATQQPAPEIACESEPPSGRERRAEQGIGSRPSGNQGSGSRVWMTDEDGRLVQAHSERDGSKLASGTAEVSTYLPYGTNWFDDFESGWGNWTADVIQMSTTVPTEWEIGNPSGWGPGTAYSGSNCAGTNIDDWYYPYDADITLTSPLVQLQAGPQILSFYTWYNMRQGCGWSWLYPDGGFVEISDGGPWQQIFPMGWYPVENGQFGGYYTDGFGGHSDGWENYEFDLSAWSGDVVQVRFHFATSSCQQWYTGWYIDDVYFGVPPPFRVELESGVEQDYGFPDDYVMYPFLVTNTGLNDDTYDLGQANHILPWTVAFLDSGMNMISAVGPLSYGESDFFWAAVHISPGALPGEFDNPDIFVTSQSDIGVFDSAKIQTQVPNELDWLDDFESGPGAWMADVIEMSTDAPTEWEIGDPDGSGPGTAYSGSQCAGTNIDADYYPYNADLTLTSPYAQLASSASILSFYTWYDIHYGCGWGPDGGFVEISDGTGWEQIYPNGGYPIQYGYFGGYNTDGFAGSSSGWEYYEFDLSAWSGDVVQIRFHFATESCAEYPGWYVDDVGISVPTYYLDLSSTSKGYYGHPGDDVYCGFTLTNKGTNDDTYDLTYANLMPWALALYDTAMNPINTIGPLSTMESFDFWAVASIPGGASEGEYDRIDVFATSQGDGSIIDTAQVRVQALYTMDWFEDFESGWGAWTAEVIRMSTDAPTEWEFGDPDGFGPGIAYSDWNCAGTNIDDWYYPYNADITLTSPLVELGTGQHFLAFETWYDMRQGCGWRWNYPDGGFVELNDGSGWAQIYPMGGYPVQDGEFGGYNTDGFGGSSSGWEHYTFDLSAYADEVVQIRFHFATSSCQAHAGWYVDDVEIYYQPPYALDWFEDFESGWDLWTTEVIRMSSNAPTEWEIGDPNGWGPGGAYSGSQCAGTNIEDVYYPYYADITLVSPYIQLAPVGNILTFQTWYSMRVGCGWYPDGGFVEISDGGPWQQIYPIGGYPVQDGYFGGYNTDGFGGNSFGWEHYTFELSAWAGDVVQIRFHFATESCQAYEGWYLDDVEIFSPPYWCDLVPDMQMNAAVPGSEAIHTMTILNQGYNDDTYDLSFAGNTWATAIRNIADTMDINSISVPAGGSADFLVKVSVPGAAAIGDADTADVTATSQNGPVLDVSQAQSMAGIVAPFFDDFEVSDPYITDDDNMNPGTQWEWGAPAFGPGAAYSGSNCWGTNMATGNYVWGADCFLYLPPVDATSLAIDTLSFYQWYDIGYNLDDGGWLEASIDGGATWEQILPSGGYPYQTAWPVPPLYTSVPCYAGQSGGWVYAEFDVNEFTGHGVMFRLRFWSDPWSGSGHPGWYIDDISITVPPTYRCALTPESQNRYGIPGGLSVTYMLTLTNTGAAGDTYDLSSSSVWPVGFYDWTGMTPITSLGPIQFGHSANFMVTVTVPGGALPGDFDVADLVATSQADAMVSDTAHVMTYVPFATDWFEDFESGQGIWTTEIIRMSTNAPTEWEIGDPSGYGPGTAFSGSQCAGTNIDDYYYPYDADITLVTPFVELGAGPQILSFYTWYDMHIGWCDGHPDGGFVELNDGSGWAQIYPMGRYPIQDGRFGGYHTDGFGGQSAGWEYYEFDLSAYADEVVQIRFHFATKSCRAYAGWYLDDVFIGAPPPYRCELAPEFQTGYGSPGKSVNYYIDLVNTGWSDDTFDLSSASVWPMTFWSSPYDMIISEQFEGAFPPAGWTVEDYNDWGMPPGELGYWHSNDYTEYSNDAGTGYCAEVNSDELSDAWTGSGGVDSGLQTPLFDLIGYASARLEFDMFYEDEYTDSDDYAQVWIGYNGGMSWNLLAEYDADFGPDYAESISLSHWIGEDDVFIEFYYYDNDEWCGWWQVDNVQIYGITGGISVPITELSIEAGDSANFIARVAIPGGAMPGDFDLADITATSQNDPMVSSYTAQVQTQVPYGIDWFDDFESGQGPWTTEVIQMSSNTPTEWEIGNPNGYGPGTAFSGTQCAGTNIDDYYYPYDADITLQSPYVQLGPGLNILSFQTWYDMHRGGCNRYPDGGFVELNDGTGWEQIYPIDGYPVTDGDFGGYETDGFSGSSSGWEYYEFDLSAYADEVVQVRFHFATESCQWYNGWYVDDVFIGSPPPYRCDLTPEYQMYFAGPDWYVNYLVEITNTGTNDDTYDLSLSGNTWPTVFRDLADTVVITTLSVPASSSLDFVVKVHIPSWAVPGDFDLVDVIATSQADGSVFDEGRIRTEVTCPILLVDDETFTYPANSASYYRDALDAGGYIYNYWQTAVIGSPTLAALQSHQVVVWFTGNSYNDYDAGGTLTPTDRTNLENYLTGGGRFYFSSSMALMDATNWFGGSDNWSGWYQTWLHASIVWNFNQGAFTMAGTANDPISDSLDLQTHTGNCCPGLWGYNAALAPTGSGIPFYTQTANGYTVGMHADTGTYRVVYTSFDFADVSGTDTRTYLMHRIINWLMNTDITPPTIISTIPANGATGVYLNADIVVTFSEPMRSTNMDMVVCIPDPTNWTMVLSQGGRVATFSHANDFAPGTLYEFTFFPFAVDLLGNGLVAGPVPNPWTFTTGSTSDTDPPTITLTSPIDGATGVAYNADIVVTFSEAMNTASVTYSCLPNPGGAWNVVWSAGDTVATFSHVNDFSEGIIYTFQITGGTDMAGNAMDVGAVPNPWLFTSLNEAPTIISTVPADGAIGVGLNADIVITFSEPMDTSWVSWGLNNDPGNWVITWSMGNTVATFAHNPFAPYSTYTFSVNVRDPAGNYLVAGAVPNPWTFQTGSTTPPTITNIVPNDGATGISLNSNIVVSWSEGMDTGTGTVDIVPAPLVAGTWAWSGLGDIVYTYTGATWQENTLYTLTFNNFQDDDEAAAAGGDLVKEFTTLGNPPSITTIVPDDHALNVALNSAVTVTWSEGMDATVGAVNIDPTPLVAGTWAWSGAGDTTYTYSGATWQENTIYTLTFNNFADDQGVAAIGDLTKVFTTIAVPPTIVSTVPANGATDVALNANVVVTFSEPMDTTIVTHNCVPGVAGWAVAWSAGNTVATFTHTNAFVENTGYTFQIWGGDANGVTLVAGAVPNPWTFTTIGIPPTITNIVPADGAAGVTAVTLDAPIVVTWSEGMNAGAGTVNIVPAPLVAGTWAWSGAGDTTYTYSGATWDNSTHYTLTFNGFQDDQGVAAAGDLVKEFTTLDILTIGGADLAAGSPQAGEANYSFLSLGLVASGNTVTLTRLSAQLLGTGTSANITAVKLFLDNSGNGLYEYGETLLSSTTFTNGFANFTGLNVVVTNPTVTRLCILMDVSADYTVGETIGVKVYAAEVAAPDLLNPFVGVSSTELTILPDTTIPPRVQSTNPTNGATNVPRTSAVTVTFSEDMNATTINALNISVSGGLTPTNFVFSAGNRSVTFNVPFAYATTYTITLNGSAIKDLAGNTLDGNGNGTAEGAPKDNYTWSFTTELAPDATPPVSEAADLPNYATTMTISITYTVSDPAVAGATTSGVKETELWYRLNGGTWKLYGTFIATTISFNTNTTGGDGFYEFYTRARDVANNYEDAPGTPDASITVDTVRPTATLTALPTYTLTTSFTVTATAADLTSGVDRVVLYYRLNGGAWVALPADSAAPYEWTFDTATTGGNGFYEFYAMVYDEAGNAKAVPGAVAEAFTTVDTIAPTATGTPSGANITVSANVTVTFSEPVNRTLAQAAFSISPNVAGTFVWNIAGTVMTFVPDVPFGFGAQYSVSLNATGIVDLAGNHMAADKTWTFSTLAQPAAATGTISGRVVDQDGIGVPGATVTIQGTSFTTTTDANGGYTFTNVPIGNYTITASKNGYDPDSEAITVSANANTAVPNLTLVMVDEGGISGNMTWIVLALVIAMVAGLLLFLLLGKKNKAKPVDEHEYGPAGQPDQPEYGEPQEGAYDQPPPPPND